MPESALVVGLGRVLRQQSLLEHQSVQGFRRYVHGGTAAASLTLGRGRFTYFVAVTPGFRLVSGCFCAAERARARVGNVRCKSTSSGCTELHDMCDVNGDGITPVTTACPGDPQR